MALPKWSNENLQILQVGEKSIAIPPRTGVMPSILAIQMHPKYWEDPDRWNPKRWVAASSTSLKSTSDLAKTLRSECVVKPVQSTYFPWSDGPQNCPGEKFAQVEFVAVLAILLRDHRVSVVQVGNETIDEARERALAVTQDCNMELLLRMRDADRVRLRWRKV